MPHLFPSRASRLSSFGRLSLVGALAGAWLLLAWPAVADTQVRDARRAIERVREETGGRVKVRLQPATGVARLLRFDPDGPGMDAPDKAAAPEARAQVHLVRFGDAFGISNPAEQLTLVGVRKDATGSTHIEYRQTHAGVEVFGATLRVHLDAEGRLSTIHGAFVPDVAGLDTSPRVSAQAAAAIARAAIADDLNADDTSAGDDATTRNGRAQVPDTSRTRLLVFRENLARGIPGTNHLAWEVEVREGPDVREFVYVDAHKGHVVDRISGIHEALDRRVYDGGLDETFLVWSEGDPFPTADQDIDNLVEFAEDTYNLFSSLTGGAYLSFDGADAVMHSVNNSPTIGCPNASWNGVSTNYCSGVTGDDTVAHEWAHAYTQHTHGLIYQWQPGALNESYSDIWGEVVDILNGAGTDTPAPPRSVGECSTLGRGPGPEFTVDGPPELAGAYFAAGATFNPPPPVTVTAPIEVAFDGNDADGCQALLGFTPGNIALIDRGTCTFPAKVTNAKNAGAVGVVIVNTSDGAFTMSGAGTLNIPAVMIGLSDGATIRNAAEAVSATLTQNAATETSWRWLAAEDDPGFGGAIRDMWTPTCYGDAGKVSDLEYQCATGDSGGVHSNSGVPNHAFALLVDGGVYNGRTIAQVALVKVAHIYWRAQSVYQTPVSDFSDHGDSLELACADLIGAPLLEPDTDSPVSLASAEVISAADCVSVAEAIAAVEFHLDPALQCDFQPLLAANAPPPCDAGEQVLSAQYDFESGLAGWTAGTRAVVDPATFDTPDWDVVSSLPSDRGGSAAFVADLRIGNCQDDTEAGVLFLESPGIALAGGVDAPRLAFDHWVATEAEWDGGNVKLSVNGGPWTLVPAAAFVFNPYTKTLRQGDNPLAGEPAFTGTDGGKLSGSWGQSQVDLAGLATGGDSIRLRFEMGLDGCNGVTGWYVDDVRLFSCAACSASDWYADEDGDAYGDAAVSVAACAAPPGFVADAQDCDDTNAAIHPGAAEACNDGLDNDCSPATPDVFDADADTFACDVDCDDLEPAGWSVPGAASGLTFADPQTLAWDPPAEPGGSAVVYDVLRSSSATDFVGGGTCVETGDADTVYLEPGDPPSGEIWYYLVRPSNACPGAGPLGVTSAGGERVGLTCPAAR